ncbi:hypothetical protein CGLO_12140 [Colletotrichum gloeosporioides Cg-14]|uniref:Uncharacterized protein n=1 Tax=Colletotrichum gloeosporioides (strain Cg-14) TaxID=1237896 RepID=T0K6K8_COLGC|nr:hypothetical protein CGLO_12140 [Colletotrichum gloeosporioides Cg-14]
MTHQTPHLLTKGELRRVEECAKENGTFAECWNSDQVVIVGCEPVGAHVCVTETPFMELDILSPTANPLSGSKSSKQHPTRQCCKKKIIVLEKSNFNKRLRLKPWHYRYGSTEELSLYYDDGKAKVKEIFSQLAAEYVSVCIVSHDMQDSLSSLQKFDIELPSTTIFVDLIKVLEHQSRHDGQGIPKALRKYTDDNIAIRNGRYDRRPWPLAGQYGMPNYALVEVLGPAAEGCRRDKTEKEDTALKRIAKRAAVDNLNLGHRRRS